MEYDDLLNMGTELGYQLMFSGAEIYRVEESVFRLLTAYGLQPQVFAIPNCLIVSLNTPQGHPITRMRRIPTHGTDIELLERCNDLCRRLCREVPPVEQAKELIDGLSKNKRQYSTRVLLFGYVVAAAFFAAFFNGSLLDGVSAGICGLGVGVWMLYLGGKLGFNGFFQTLIGAAIASLLALVDRMAESAIDPAGQTIFISHGDCEADAEFVADEVRRRFGVQDIYINYVGPVIGNHSGPGTLALFFLGSRR